MARRRYLITYDITDDKRRNKIFQACEREGDHTQYSVFVAELDDRELSAMLGELSDLIDAAKDQVLFADLGPAEREAGRIIASLGRPYEPMVRALVV